MASTYTTTGIELITDGEQSNTWGQTTNTNFELFEEMITGVVSVALSSTSATLTTTDGASSNGRHAVIVFTGTPGGTCTVTVSPNNMQKVYLVKNDSDQTVTLTQGSGGNVSVAASKTKIVYCDGAGSGAEVVDLSNGFDSTTLADLGITATAAELNIMDGVTATAAELNILDGVTATATELNYVDGVTSNVQTQLDARVAKTSSTGSAILPTGTTLQRDGSPSAGYFRFNSTYGAFEGYNGTDWGSVGGAAGAGGDQVFYENDQTVTSSYSITSGKNAMSAGPITINSGISVTVPSGSVWTIV